MSGRNSFLIHVDSSVCAILNSFRMIMHSVDFRGKQLIKKNKKLLLSCKTDDSQPVCFVLGNGPSLNASMLTEIAQYPSITVNFFHQGFQNFHSSYHVCVDPGFGDAEHAAYMQDIVKSNPDTKFLLGVKAGRAFLQKNTEVPNNVYFMKCNQSQHGDLLRIDMCKPMTMCPNVLPAAIQCAIFMGYKRIYLLGCEFGLYGLFGKGHFYDDNDGAITPTYGNTLHNLFNCGLVHAHHSAIAKYCVENDIIIQNLTPISNLREYEINSLENVIRTLGKV